MAKRRRAMTKAIAILPFTAVLSVGCETGETPEGDTGTQQMAPQGQAPEQQGTDSPFGQPPPEEEERRRQPGDPASPGDY